VSKPLKIVPTVPDREREICIRLRQVRMIRKLKQTDFAHELGLSRVTLASYEYARAPLRYGVAKILIKRFNVNQVWLAEGKGSMGPDYEFDSSIETQISPKMLFSEAYERFLKPVTGLFRYRDKFGSFSLIPATPLGMPLGEERKWLLQKEIAAAIDNIPENKRLEFARAILNTVRQFEQKLKASPKKK